MKETKVIMDEASSITELCWSKVYAKYSNLKTFVKGKLVVHVPRQYWDKPTRNRNKMPLVASEIRVLAELHGRPKKYYVKKLKAKYA